METILEESDHSLGDVDEAIARLEGQQLANREDDPEMQAYREMAEANIERELQYMKKHYDPNAPAVDPAAPGATHARAAQARATSALLKQKTQAAAAQGPLTMADHTMSAA